MPARPFDFRAILRKLLDEGVEFIVVGGVSAVLNGAPISTFDLDIVHLRTPDNIDRLMKALQGLDAHYRFGGNQIHRTPDASHLSSPGDQLLMTSAGPLDVLGSLSEHRSYPELLPDTLKMEFEVGRSIRVLTLETLLSVKRSLNQEKDRAVIPIIEQTIKERAKRSDDSASK